jgi:hypothetical protein
LDCFSLLGERARYRLFDVSCRAGSIARRPFFVMADVAENARYKAQGKSPTTPISPLALEAGRLGTHLAA